PGSQTVPTPIGVLPIVVATRPRTMSYQEGTVVVTSMVPTPPSMAARQARKPASESSVRRTPQTPLGKTVSMLRKPGPLSPHPGLAPPFEARARTGAGKRFQGSAYTGTYV